MYGGPNRLTFSVVADLEKGSKTMNGHWQKEVPSKEGTYHVAARNGEHAGTKVVAYLPRGLVYAGGHIGIGDPPDSHWSGWWWSEPMEVPPAPPSW